MPDFDRASQRMLYLYQRRDSDSNGSGRQPFFPPVLSGMAACSVRIRKVKLSSI